MEVSCRLIIVAVGILMIECQVHAIASCLLHLPLATYRYLVVAIELMDDRRKVGKEGMNPNLL